MGQQFAASRIYLAHPAAAAMCHLNINLISIIKPPLSGLFPREIFPMIDSLFSRPGKRRGNTRKVVDRALIEISRSNVY